MEKTAKKAVAPTKITPPKASNPFQRPRLFRQLDQLISGSIVWLAGSPGSGKTTLVSSYLAKRRARHLWYQLDAGDANLATFFHYFRLAILQEKPNCNHELPVLSPEYLSGLTTFIRRYAEIISDPLKPPVMIVLDNYELVPSESALHEAIRDLASYLPPKFCVVVLSRTEPPPVYARLRLHGELVVLDSTALNLTPDEAQSFVATWQASTGIKPSAGDIACAYHETQGWIAGFTLLIADPSMSNGAHELGGNQQMLFDYFATEFFQHFSSDVQRGLMSTALLPSMSAHNVEQLTGAKDMVDRLVGLQNRNCFVAQRGQTEPVYEYHAMFRVFLLNQARTAFPPDEWQGLQKKAANLLEASGQTDAAVELYSAAEDWAGLAALVMSEGAGLISQGRHQVLEQWLKSLPPDSFKQSPWICYWQGMARLPFAPVDARGHFERAFLGFKQDDTVDGLYLAWAGIMDTFFYEWQDLRPADPWIAEFETLRARHDGFPSLAVELRTYRAMGTLLHRHPHHPFVAVWAERAEALLSTAYLESSIQVGGYLVIHYLWRGDTAKAENLIARIGPWVASLEYPSLVSVLWRCGVSLFHSVKGDLRACLEVAEEGLALAHKAGFTCWDFLLSAQVARCSLIAGDLATADTWLSVMANTQRNQHSINGGFHEHLQANAAMQRDNWPKAMTHARRGLAMALESGIPFLEANCRIDLARILITQGEYDEWIPHLEIACRISQQEGSKVLQYLCLEIKAYAAYRQGVQEVERLAVAEAIAFSMEMGEPTWQVAGPKARAEFYERALVSGTEIEYVRGIIQKCHLAPSNSAIASKHWPWPVRIHTLGRFEILLNGTPLKASRKAQHKPLELIKILCALGGQAIHQDRVTEALWPDADGDAAEQALNTTLHRLRKLLQNDQLVRFEDRQLSLDFQHLWVDALAFDHIARQPNQSEDTLLYALDIYQGQFLQGEPAPWALVFRERLRKHFLKLSERLGALYEQLDDLQSAIDCYHRVIETEPLAETFYRQLMTSYAKTGQRAEALTLYLRCRQYLLAHLGVGPARETQELYQKLIEN